MSIGRLGWLVPVVLLQIFRAAMGWSQEAITLTYGVDIQSNHILSSEEVAKLLTRPKCFGSPDGLKG
jgi:hypothetical protein